MNIHTPVDSAAKGQMTDAEWEARVDLAAVYRLVAHNGWDDVILAITARCACRASRPSS